MGTIQSNELRVNNWYNGDAEGSYINGSLACTIKAGENLDFQLTETTFKALIAFDAHKYIQGIPLTEEWLVKFGFKNKPNEMYINKSQYLLQVTGEYEEDGSINRDETWFDGIGDYSWIKEGGLKTMSVNVLCRGNYVCNCAKYVHQLQNLYFALTGQELTIKPEQ